jgi:LacI family transcriptional regulator
MRTPPPTAIFASNLTLAVGALAGLQEAGLKVPKDISVIGLHDAPLATVVQPPLTVVKMPLFDMGYQATNTLIRILNKQDAMVPVTLPPTGLIIRKSTDKPR